MKFPAYSWRIYRRLPIARKGGEWYFPLGFQLQPDHCKVFQMNVTAISKTAQFWLSGKILSENEMKMK